MDYSGTVETCPTKLSFQLSIVATILQHAQTIYVKGSEKINRLTNFLARSLRIVNLETLDCPALEKIDDTSSAECFHNWNAPE